MISEVLDDQDTIVQHRCQTQCLAILHEARGDSAALQFRCQHLKAIADRGAGVAAEARNGIDLSGIDAQPFRVDDAVAIVRVDDLAHDDLPDFPSSSVTCRWHSVAAASARSKARRPSGQASPSVRLPSIHRRRADISNRRHASPPRWQTSTMLTVKTSGHADVVARVLEGHIRIVSRRPAPGSADRPTGS